MKYAIIGAGKMGKWFTEFFLQEGENVVVSDKDEKKLAKIKKDLKVETAHNMEAVKGADRILLCVPMENMEDVVKEIHLQVQSHQIVMDICSEKKTSVKIMHQYIRKGLVLGTHPVFGPGVKSIANQNFILTPSGMKEKRFAKEFKSWLEKRNACVSIMSPRRHDEVMSVVLGFPHFLGLAVCQTFLDCSDLHKIEKIAGPSCKMLLTFAKAVLSEETRFYTSLQMNLPETTKIVNLFLEKSTEWLSLIKHKDAESLARKMDLLKTRLAKIDTDYDSAYAAMHKTLEISAHKS
jgi:prephenate dehydrogenase